MQADQFFPIALFHEKPKLKTPVAVLGSDKITKIFWQYIKDELDHPFLDFNCQ